MPKSHNKALKGKVGIKLSTKILQSGVETQNTFKQVKCSLRINDKQQKRSEFRLNCGSLYNKECLFTWVNWMDNSVGIFVIGYEESVCKMALNCCLPFMHTEVHSMSLFYNSRFLCWGHDLRWFCLNSNFDADSWYWSQKVCVISLKETIFWQCLFSMCERSCPAWHVHKPEMCGTTWLRAVKPTDPNRVVVAPSQEPHR